MTENKMSPQAFEEMEKAVRAAVLDCESIEVVRESVHLILLDVEKNLKISVENARLRQERDVLSEELEKITKELKVAKMLRGRAEAQVRRLKGEDDPDEEPEPEQPDPEPEAKPEPTPKPEPEPEPEPEPAEEPKKEKPKKKKKASKKKKDEPDEREVPAEGFFDGADDVDESTMEIIQGIIYDLQAENGGWAIIQRIKDEADALDYDAETVDGIISHWLNHSPTDIEMDESGLKIKLTE